MHRVHGAGALIHEDGWMMPDKAQIIKTMEKGVEQQKDSEWDMLEDVTREKP